MPDLLRIYVAAIRSGYLLYRAEMPVTVELTTSFPRIALQGAFYIILGRLLGGAHGAEFALAGAAAFGGCTSAIIAVCDVPATDQWEATYFRLQAGAISPGVVHLLRSIPYFLSGMAASVIVLCVDAPVLGLAHSVLPLLAALPLYCLAVASSTMFGLAIAVVAASVDQDVLFGNVASYVVLALAGIVAPPDPHLRWLGPVSSVLPLTHGLVAIRAFVADRPWAPEAGWEIAIGFTWATVALAFSALRDRYTRGALGIRWRRFASTPE